MRQPEPDPLQITLTLRGSSTVGNGRRSPISAEQCVPRGLDFGLSDPLGLSRLPGLKVAALRALTNRTPFSPGAGPTVTEDQLAQFCQMATALTFPSGNEAIRATLGHLLRPDDTVILDFALPPIFARTVRSARARLCFSPPGLVDAVERRLSRLSRQQGARRIFICVPAVSPYGSATADLRELVSLAAIHRATLIVDISHDLGAMGLSGQGLAEIQGCLGQCDVLVGSLASTFGVVAGLAASREHALLAGLRAGKTHAALPAIRSAALSKALGLVWGDEGHIRRRQLRGNGLRLRNHLMAEGLRLLGQPSPIVPVPLPPGREMQISALLASAGPIVPLITAPLVGRHSSRLLVRLSADHSLADIDNLAELLVEVSRAARLRP